MYYPSSQITSNLYTNGNEYTLKSTGENYIGFYWKTLNGKFFTGKTPQDTPIQELVIASSKFSQTPSTSLPQVDLALTYDSPYIGDNPDLYNEKTILNYLNVKKIDNVNPPTTNLPTYSPNTPTQSDYDVGEFTRYFCKKTNEIIYLEINKDTYTKLVSKDQTYLFQMYTPFKFQWTITGEKEKVYTSNRNITRYMSEKFNLPFLNKYLKEDYLKYYK